MTSSAEKLEEGVGSSWNLTNITYTNYTTRLVRRLESLLVLRGGPRRG